MLLALLSDSHDHVANVRAALDLIAPHHPDLYVHLGDFTSPDLLDLFAGLTNAAGQPAPLHFVFGNGDYDRATARASALRWGFICHERHGALTLDGRALAFLHGDDHNLLHRLLDSQQFDYVLHGHSHRAADTRYGKTRLINPGALYRAHPKSIALLDLPIDRLTPLILPEP